MKKPLSLVFMLIMMVTIVGVIVAYEKHTESETIQIGKYKVTYYIRFGTIPDSADLAELQNNPAVWDIAWSDPTGKSGQYLWYDWVKGRGYIHNGSEYTEL